MRRFVLVLGCLLFVSLSQAALIQHLDGARPNSVVFEPLQTDPNSFRVGTWVDQSSNGNNAVPQTGNVDYPTTLAGGFPGLDFGPTTLNSLKLFANVGTESLLNFKAGGAAEGNTGFCVLFSMRCDELGILNYDLNDILGVTSAIADGGFGIRYDSWGTLSAYLGGTGYGRVRGTTSLTAGDTAVVGFNWNKATGALDFWDSKNNSSLTNTKAAADFTEKGNNLWLGAAAVGGARFLRGAIGEVKIYNSVLTGSDYAYQQQQLVRKWVTSRALFPLNGQEVMKKSSIELSWLNLLPENQGDPVYVNVWFGTDPNKLGSVYTKVVDGVQDAVSVTVDASAAGTYYWQVDTHFGYPISEPNMLEGPVWSFTAVDDPAPTAVNAGPDMITWANQPLTMNPVITDEGASAISYTWSCSDPNAVFVPSNTVQNPAVSTDWEAGQVTVTVAAEDAANPGETVQDSMQMTVYASACQAARIGNSQAINWPQDLVPDCIINFEDFAQIASIWLADYSAPAPFEKP